jgi:hypothetical protein
MLKLKLLLLFQILKLLIPCQKIYPLNPSLNPLLQNLIRNPLKIKSCPLLSTNSWLIQNAPQRRRRRNTCRSCSVIRSSSHTCCSEGQNTGGIQKTSTLGVITRGQLSPCSRSKEEIASEATPKLSGHLIVTMLVIVMRCCSTSLANVTSSTNEQEKRYSADLLRDLTLVGMSLVHILNHLMVMKSAVHLQITLFIVSLLKVVRTASLTRTMDSSQLLNWKYGN